MIRYASTRLRAAYSASAISAASLFAATFFTASSGIADAACVAPPANLEHWWRGESDATDVAGGNDGSVAGALAFSPAVVGQGFDFAAGGVVTIPHAATLNITASGFTVEFWEKGPAVGIRTMIDKSHGGSDSTGWAVQTKGTPIDVAIGRGGGGTADFAEAGTAASTPLDGSFHHFAFTWADSDDTLRVYVDGVPRGTVVVATPVNNTRSLLLGRWWWITGREFVGMLDELSVYSRALSSVEIASIFAAGSDGKCSLCGNGVTDPGETCDGTEPGVECCNGACDGYLPDGTACTSDGQFCNGTEVCSSGTCSGNTGDPCTSECLGTCNESSDTCFDAPGTPCGSDGEECTDDECDGAGNCLHPANTAPCDDGLFCNGDDSCSDGECTVHDGDPCSGGDDCQNACNESADNCLNLSGSSCASDGNPCTDDECDGTGACTHPANTDPCDDGDVCTEDDVCAATVCDGTPVVCDDDNACTQDSCSAGCIFDPSPLPDASCVVGLKNSLQVKNPDGSDKDQIKWKLGSGEQFAHAALGSPDMDTEYSLCIYDRSTGTPSVATRLVVPPSALWLEKAPKGFFYKDKLGSIDGVTKVSLKPGDDLKTSVQVQAKGAMLPALVPASPTTTFDQAPSVTVQLVGSSGFCATSTFSAAQATKNDGEQFKAKAP